MNLTTGYWPLVVLLIAPVFAVLGTLLGAFVNSRLAERNEQRRWEREHQVRYNQDRARLYGEFLAGNHNAANELNSLWIGWLEGGKKQKDAVVPAALNPVMRAAYVAFSSAILLASPPVRESARELHRALGRLFNPPEDAISLDAAFKEFEKTRESFIGAVWEELGLTDPPRKGKSGR